MCPRNYPKKHEDAGNIGIRGTLGYPGNIGTVKHGSVLGTIRGPYKYPGNDPRSRD